MGSPAAAAWASAAAGGLRPRRRHWAAAATGAGHRCCCCQGGAEGEIARGPRPGGHPGRTPGQTPPPVAAHRRRPEPRPSAAGLPWLRPRPTATWAREQGTNRVCPSRLSAGGEQVEVMVVAGWACRTCSNLRRWLVGCACLGFSVGKVVRCTPRLRQRSARGSPPDPQGCATSVCACSSKTKTGGKPTAL